MTQLQSMLEQSRKTTSGSITAIFHEVSEGLKAFAPNAVFTVVGDDQVFKVPEYYLRSVLLNLMSNAIRASFEHGSPSIRVSLEIEKTGFSVCDNGPGFTQAVLESFKTGKISSTSPYGSGLGIQNSKKLIENYSGSVTLGNGSSGGRVRVIFR